MGSWFVEAPGVGGVRDGLIELLLPDPLSEEIGGHLLVGGSGGGSPGDAVDMSRC